MFGRAKRAENFRHFFQLLPPQSEKWIDASVGWQMSHKELKFTTRSKVTSRGQRPFLSPMLVWGASLCMQSWARHILAIALYSLLISKAQNMTYMHDCAYDTNSFLIVTRGEVILTDNKESFIEIYKYILLNTFTLMCAVPQVSLKSHLINTGRNFHRALLAHTGWKRKATAFFLIFASSRWKPNQVFIIIERSTNECTPIHAVDVCFKLY